jgi:hypothetical protein
MNQELQMDKLDIQQARTSGFTPNPSNFKKRISQSPNLSLTSGNFIRSRLLNGGEERKQKSEIKKNLDDSAFLTSDRKTVTLCMYKTLNDSKEFKENKRNSIPSPIEENWLYMTNSKPGKKFVSQKASDISPACPQWFNLMENPAVKNHSIEKSIGFDGTVTVLSRISGWMTVSPKSRNRSKRLGKFGPINKSKKGNDLQNVSDLAPFWMQSEYQRNKSSQFRNTLAHPCQRKELKRVTLVEKEQIPKSIFSYGDFRHNVLTSQEARESEKGLTMFPKRLIEWNEDMTRQSYDKPVSGKVGSLNK